MSDPHVVILIVGLAFLSGYGLCFGLSPSRPQTVVRTMPERERNGKFRKTPKP